MIGGVHQERRQKGDVEFYFLPGDRTFASRKMIEAAWIPFTTELAAVKLGFRISVVKLRSVPESNDRDFVTGGIGPRHHAHIGRVHRVDRKDMIQLDIDAGDVRKRRPAVNRPTKVAFVTLPAALK